MVPLVDVVVSEAVRRALQSESRPKGWRLICLLNEFNLGRGSLVLLHQSEMVQSCLLISLQISSGNFTASPQPGLISCLNNEKATRVQHFTDSRGARTPLHIQILLAQSGHHKVRVLNLVRANQEHPGRHSQGVKVRLVKSLVEPVQLLDESHVRVDALAALLQELVALLVGALLTKDLVRQNNSG